MLFGRLLRRPVRLAVGYPSALVRFSIELGALGLDGRRLGWEVIICTAEMLSDEDREALGSAFGARVVDSYGCAEAGVDGFECEAGGMHIPIESVVVERLTGAGGNSELLLTDLHNRMQPLIRYRVGDLAEAAESGPCRCGRAHPRLGRLTGRVSDSLTLADGRGLNPHLLTYVFKSRARRDVVREYQFRQLEDERLEVWIVPGAGWSSAHAAALSRDLLLRLGCDVPIRRTDQLLRTGRGKHRDVVRGGTGDR